LYFGVCGKAKGSRRQLRTGFTIPESTKIDRIRLKLQARYRISMIAAKTREKDGKINL
jgi:hypothetical protein